jgi:hypothetical protein
MFSSPWFGLVLLCSACLIVVDSFAEELPTAPPASTPAGASEARTSQQRADDLAVLTKAAAGYMLKLENGHSAELRREPVYRWSNSIAATIGRHVRDAAMFVWVSEERPVVIGSVVWYAQVGLYHEFQSLSFEPLTAERERKEIWEPAHPGIEFKPLPDAPPAATTEAKRLIQMKSFAGRFRAEVIKGPPSFPEGSVWQLRLLPKPLLRYGSPAGLARDGAIFAFCQDTDPDVFLMLEARAAGDELEWHFAMGPLTSREAKGWYDDTLVWSKPLIAPPTDPKRPYFVAGPLPAP